jgi:hypothetical protein
LLSDPHALSPAATTNSGTTIRFLPMFSPVWA